MSFDLRMVSGRLIVSCQAPAASPLNAPEHLAAMAQAAVQGGAAAIRANGPHNIAAIRAAVDVPIIGLYKRIDPDGTQWITPTVADALAIERAGADVIAIEASLRPRTLGPAFDRLLAELRAVSDVAVMADVDTLEAGQAAEAAGADAVASTLAGYTPLTAAQPHDEPDVELVRRLAVACRVPVVAEGRYATGEHVRAALAAGATAVVVGTAITEPIELTARLVAAAARR